MTYSDKLKSPKWQKKRLQILERDNWQCQYCKDTESQLQVHHLKYTGEPWEAKNEDLITTCCDCHEILSHIKFNFISIQKYKAKIGDGNKFICKGNYDDLSEGFIFIYNNPKNKEGFSIGFSLDEIENIKLLL
jgi:hypothetical protein